MFRNRRIGRGSKTVYGRSVGRREHITASCRLPLSSSFCRRMPSMQALTLRATRMLASLSRATRISKRERPSCLKENVASNRSADAAIPWPVREERTQIPTFPTLCLQSMRVMPTLPRRVSSVRLMMAKQKLWRFCQSRSERATKDSLSCKE